MDTIKIVGMVLGLVVGAANLPNKQSEAPEQPATTLVGTWPVSETVDEPVVESADPIDDMVADMQSYRPKPESSTTCECDCDCPDEERLRVILKEELAIALRAKMQATSISSGGSAGSGASNGGSSTGGSVATQTYSQPVSTNPFPVARTVSSYRDYQVPSGCTVRETTYSDGTTSRQTMSCPLQGRQTIRQRFGR